MKPKVIAASTLALLASSCVSAKDPNYHWTKIGAGPTYEYADAQCRMMAQGQQQGMFAMGSPGFVAGATMGNAIGNAIRMEEFYKNCMTMSGWKREKNPPGVKTKY